MQINCILKHQTSLSLLYELRQLKIEFSPWKVAGLIPGCACRLQPFRVFPGFIQNSSIYQLGLIRKSPHGECSPCRPRSHAWTTGLNPIIQPNSEHRWQPLQAMILMSSCITQRIVSFLKLSLQYFYFWRNYKQNIDDSS